MDKKDLSAPLGHRFHFDRHALQSERAFTFIGEGELGGKASGLAFIHDTIQDKFPHSSFPDVKVSIPAVTVLSTAVFDAFMEQNKLYDVALSDASDEYIAMEFQRASFPYQWTGDLRALVSEVKTPLAVRSSSMLEDAMFKPFAGVFATKMIPNNQHSTDERFKKLMEAVKFVFASTFFKGAKDYIATTGKSIADEKMAVVIQKVVGQQHEEKWYPTISGVAKSFNFYPFGRAKPEQGVVNLALGLGKAIVDGGVCWSYVPAWPKLPPPYSNVGDLMKATQTTFWAVNLGKPPAYDPVNEAEFLVQNGLDEAEADGVLKHTASTYDAANDRLSPGTGPAGPRILTFAPILQLNTVPLNKIVQELIRLCEEALESEVEIEFALTLDPVHGTPARLGFLQVRPMVVSKEEVEVPVETLSAPNALVASEKVLGNGDVNTIRDIVYVRPEVFEAKHTPLIAKHVAAMNQTLLNEDRAFLLMGFGRWGSSDHWLGTPVEWSQIAGAKAIVEATLPSMNVEPSQGSHFFHNLSSFEVSYFFVHHNSSYPIRWDWLDALPAEEETEYVRRVRIDKPLSILVDGRTGRGVIQHG